MLHDFLTDNRGEILNRSRDKLASRHVPVPTDAELANGLPLFLDQLTSILRAEKGDRRSGHAGVGTSAALHGEELLRIGLTIGQVVQDYGSICQSVTELADEQNVAITADEFQTFNRCLDDAIAEAVTSYETQRDQTSISNSGMATLGFLAHEMRNLLMTSMLTFDALSKGNVGIHGSTGTLLGRSLRRMRALVDRTLAEVRLEAGTPTVARVLVAALLEEIEIVATIEAHDRSLQLSVEPGRFDVAVLGDHQILASVLANLVQNAIKFTVPGGHVKVRARVREGRVLIEVEDQCGGLPPGKAANLFRPFDQRGTDRSGAGLGLAISLKGVRASGGQLHVLDRPGVGCVFTVDLPLGAAQGSV